MSDIRLDWITMDPVLPAVLETDPVRLVAQRILVALRTAAGTWWLDRDFGPRYFETWLKKAPDLRLVESDLRRLLLAVPGVLRVVSVTLVLDAASRVLRVSFEVSTDAGVITAATVAGEALPGDVLQAGRFYLLMSGPSGQLGLGAGLSSL